MASHGSLSDRARCIHSWAHHRHLGFSHDTCVAARPGHRRPRLPHPASPWCSRARGTARPRRDQPYSHVTTRTQSTARPLLVAGLSFFGMPFPAKRLFMVFLSHSLCSTWFRVQGHRQRSDPPGTRMRRSHHDVNGCVNWQLCTMKRGSAHGRGFTSVPATPFSARRCFSSSYSSCSLFLRFSPPPSVILAKASPSGCCTSLTEPTPSLPTRTE